MKKLSTGFYITGTLYSKVTIEYDNKGYQVKERSSGEILNPNSEHTLKILGRGLANETVTLSAPFRDITKFALIPPHEKKFTKKIIEFEAKQQIPFLLEEVSWRHYLRTKIDSKDHSNEDYAFEFSTNKELLIMAVKKDNRNIYINQLKNLGYEPDKVIMPYEGVLKLSKPGIVLHGYLENLCRVYEIDEDDSNQNRLLKTRGFDRFPEKGFLDRFLSRIEDIQKVESYPITYLNLNPNEITSLESLTNIPKPKNLELEGFIGSDNELLALGISLAGINKNVPNFLDKKSKDN